jgi:hypothetical protein
VELHSADKRYSALTSSDPPCTLKEQQIFQAARSCGDEREGSLTTQDLSVTGFSIGQSTLDDVQSGFAGSSRFRLTSEEESPIGICVRNQVGSAIVFASGYAGGWKILDSIYMADAKTFEKLGAKCATVKALPSTPSTASGIRLGLKRSRVLALLQNPQRKNSVFQISFSAKPDKAAWVSPNITPSQGSGWTAMSGAMGEFKAGKLKWIALYGGVSN